MIRNFLKTAWRNLKKNKGYSSINISGLAIGMAVAMLIGLWIWHELSFNKSFDNYSRLGQLYQNRTFNGQTGTYSIMPQPISEELRTNYPDFKDAALTTFNSEHILSYKDKKIIHRGIFAEPQFTKMFSLKMLDGAQNGLDDVHSILLSETLAHTLFGNEIAIGKMIRVDNRGDLTVRGVFKDFPADTEFEEVTMLMPWTYLVSEDASIRGSADNWGINNYNCYVQLAENADINSVEKKIRSLIHAKVSDNDKISKPELLLLPMSRWRLYSEFTDGKNTGGFIVLVRLFAIAGLFVLILACINFMNLSTARSEKRAKEVGIRKTIGSVRMQLIHQFLSESFLVTLIAFFISLILVSVTLPWFNSILSKDIGIPWQSPGFWMISIVFIVVTALLAGSYPAFYLSSFHPIKVLKGTFKAGRFAALPRRVLVVVQFTVSVSLIIGTFIVYRQIQHARERPLGYNSNGLIYVPVNTPELQSLDYSVLRNELLSTNSVENMSKSSMPMTMEGNLSTGFSWDGSSSNSDALFTIMRVTEDHGKTIGFQLIAGRDFSRDFKSDSAGIILNETAAKLVGGKDIIGKIITGNGTKYTIIGIVKDMVRSSPYSQAMPAMFVLTTRFHNTINIKIKPTVATALALSKIEAVFKKYNPAAPFEYQFADELYAKKFTDENLIGKLAAFFAVLTVLISCLGLFGLASFMAEQRSKEIAVRKVLGASVFTLWRLLSKEFVLLVLVSLFIAIPVAYYLMNNWLQGYQYRVELSWWIFGIAGVAALVITLFTVSFQSIKAAIGNPVKNLRIE